MKELIDLIKERGPISRAEVAKRMHISEREVRALIHDANCAGVPIVFTGHGFVFAKSRGLVNDWANNQKAAAISILRKVAAVTKSDVEGVVQQLILQ